jgi:hypothetical protein
MNMNETINGLVLTKTCTVSADADNKAESKKVHLRLTFDGVTLNDVFAKALATAVIQWQTKARKMFSTISDGATVTVAFAAPGRVTVDPMVYWKQRLAACATPEEKAALIAELTA